MDIRLRLVELSTNSTGTIDQKFGARGRGRTPCFINQLYGPGVGLA